MVWEFILNRLIENKQSVFSDDSTQITYDKLIENVIHKGEVLKSKTKPKTKCCILCNNNFYTGIAMLSCWYAGLIPIPMSKNYGKDHCNKIIEVTQPDLIITDEDCQHNLTIFNIINEQFSNNNVSKIFEEILQDVGIIMCTSGTTGKPKAAMITEKALINNVINISKYFKLNNEDRILIARPLYHCAVLTGEFLISLFCGVNIVFLNSIYNPLSIIKVLKKQEITVLCATPTLFSHLATFYEKQNIESELRIIAISGECLTSETAIKLRKTFKKTLIYNVYGLTEASPRVSYLNPKLFDSYPESVGVPLENTYIKIYDDDFNSVPINTEGKVAVKSLSIMKGYYKNSELSSRMLKDDWLLTGDMGLVDNNGLLYIKGRADDMIIKAGMNIYPKEIENALKANNAFEDVLAYGIKNNYGQLIGLKVILTDDYKYLNEKKILSICSKILPHYLLPSKVEIVKELNKNASGKIIRPKQ